jgi:class 3 adenylate cyclase
MSLRTRILLAASLGIVVLTAATLTWVGVQADSFVSARVDEDLRRGQRLVVAAEAERFDRLRLVAQNIASFPQFKALLGTDVPTIRDFLRDRTTRDAGLLIVLSPLGQVITRSDAAAIEAIPDVEARWVGPALASGAATGWLTTSGHIYQAAATPVDALGTVLGVLIAAGEVDDELAQRFRQLSRDEIVLLGRDRLLGTTLRADAWPWRTAQTWQRQTTGGSGPHAVSVDGERYRAITTEASRDEPILIVNLQSRDQALAPYRRIQAGLILLGLVMASLGVAASAWFARSLTAPVARLTEGTRQVAAGNFNHRIAVDRRDELGALAQSFNAMTEGLRERADMTRFVSQSTVEMIKGRPAHGASAGERRVMTLLFSDVRGFTSLADAHTPEEAVRVLNRCLSLQATLVQRFGGDVDKFVGDAVFALFSGRDMALDAIRCAVEIHKALETGQVSDDASRPLEVGIGIATGEVILGSIGSADRLDYTAIGSHVNLASRLCSLAGSRETLLSASTWEQVKDLVAAEPLEPLTVKGFVQPVTIYRMRTGA